MKDNWTGPFLSLLINVLFLTIKGEHMRGRRPPLPNRFWVCPLNHAFFYLNSITRRFYLTSFPPSFSISLYFFLFFSFFLSFFLSLSLSIYLYLSIYLSIFLFTFLSIYLFNTENHLKSLNLYPQIMYHKLKLHLFIVL